MSKTNNLYLFTSAFPYGNGESFLDDEIPYLDNYFNLIIIPNRVPTSKYRDLPKSIKVDTNWAKMKYWEKLRKGIDPLRFLNMGISREIKIIPKKYFPIKRALNYLYLAISQCNWFLSEYKDTLSDGDILYSYWLFSTALCAGLIRESIPKVKAISRAHSFDLFENRPDNKYSYIPFRKNTLGKLDKIFAISHHGYEYLRSNFPQYKDKFSLSRIGVEKRSRRSPFIKHEYFRIISCSNLESIKRVDLIISALCILREYKKTPIIEWFHFGDGPLKELITRKAQISLLPKDIKYKFWGYLPKDEILNYYKNNIVDVFINVSAFEGLPVSIMEALSYAIPVIATNVGGTKELVDSDVGMLIDSDPSPEYIAGLLSQVMEWPIEKNLRIRKNALAKWEEKVNAEKNYLSFIKQFSQINPVNDKK